MVLIILAANVMTISELASRFQIHWLVEFCDYKIKKWIDIPSIECLPLDDLHGLKALKVNYTQIKTRD